MKHRSHRHCGPHRGGPHRDRLPGDRTEWLARLEEHQRDLEQRTADVADLIRRLRHEPTTPAEPTTATA